jgi:hypothetical protein
LDGILLVQGQRALYRGGGMYEVYMLLSTGLTFVIDRFGHSAFTGRIKLERGGSVGF